MLMMISVFWNVTLCHAVIVTDVSEERNASIFRDKQSKKSVYSHVGLVFLAHYSDKQSKLKFPSLCCAMQLHDKIYNNPTNA
jgi:hypothetical protein